MANRLRAYVIAQARYVTHDSPESKLFISRSQYLCFCRFVELRLFDACITDAARESATRQMMIGGGGRRHKEDHYLERQEPTIGIDEI